MHGRHQKLRPAFTLVELLAVIGIISLLIGMLVPAINSARNQAKAAATRGTLQAVSQGSEMFNGEIGNYPVSRGENPFEGEGSGVYLSGAQWVVVQLCGPDLMGYVKPVKQNDSDESPGVIDYEDWLDWYSSQPSREYPRLPRFVAADGKLAQSPTIYRKRHSFVGQRPDSLRGSDDEELPGTGGASDWNNGRIPFFVDAFGYPILYYAANSYAKAPASTDITADPPEIGVYDQSDNAVFTGSEGGNGFYVEAEDGWDLGTGPYPNSDYYHALAELGYEYDEYNPVFRPDPPPPNTFMHSIYDRNLYETTNTDDGGRVWPLRSETFMLISPGVDGRYGTLDDVRNF